MREFSMTRHERIHGMNDDQGGFRPHCESGEMQMPRHFRAHGESGDMEGFGPRPMPRRFGPHGRPPFGGPGMPPFGGHGGPGMPGRPGFPRRPNPDFLRKRMEEADLSELIDMAGRMLHRQPKGNPAHTQALILSILAGRALLSQRELQQMLGIQPGSLSELLAKLEAKGLLTREKAEDRRGNLLRITDAGRQALPSDDAEDAEDPFSPLTDEQQNQLALLLRALIAAWIGRMAAQGDTPQEEGTPV